MTLVTESRAYSGQRTSKTRSGGECEVGALGIGTYWFARIVIEITVRPRPASPGSTITVETDHPHVQFSTGPEGPRISLRARGPSKHRDSHRSGRSQRWRER